MRVAIHKSIPALALALAGLLWIRGSFGEEIDIQPQAADPSATSQDNNASDNTNDGDDNDDDDAADSEPQSVQRQMQAVKRELRGEKVNLKEAAPIRDGARQFQLRVPNYIQWRQRNIVMQQRDYSCGAACLATILKYYWGDDVTEDKILTTIDVMLNVEETEDRIKNGLAMSDLRKAAVKLGYQSVVGKTTFAKLYEMKVPAIVGIEPSGHKHFVVLRGVFGGYVYVADPIRGNIRIRDWEFQKQWQKNALLVVNKPGAKIKDYSPLSLTEADVSLGELNDQIIRSQESRTPNQWLRMSR